MTGQLPDTPAGPAPLAALAGGLAGVAGGVAALTALGRIAGFGRTAVLAAVAGRTCTADAYLTANQLPNVIFEVVAGGALAATVVPLVATAGQRDPAGVGRTGIGRTGIGRTGGSPDTDPVVARTLSALLGWVLLTLVPAAVACILLAPELAGGLTGAGCPGETRLVTRMIVVFGAQVPLYGVAVLAAGTLQAAHRFLAAAAAPLVSTVVVTAGYLVFAARLPGGVPAPDLLPRSALVALAGGTTAGVLALAATVVLAALRLPGTRRVRPSLRFPPGRGGLAARLAAAGLGTVLAAQGAAVVLTVVANRSGTPGSLASYSYAAAVYLLPAAVLTMPVTTTVLPRISAGAGPADGPVRPAPPARSAPAGGPAPVGGPVPVTGLIVGSTTVVTLLGLAGAAVLTAVAPAVGRLFDAGPGGRTGAGVGAALSWLALGVPGAALTAHLARVATALRRPGAAGLLGAGGWVLAAAGAVLAGRLASPGRMAAALGAATAAGMVGGGLLALAGWSRLPGLPGLRPLAVPAALGLAAAGVGGLLGRTAGTALLPAGGGAGGPVQVRVLLAGAAAGLAALAVTAGLVAVGARRAGLPPRLGLPPRPQAPARAGDRR